ncbi:sterol metabolism-related protein [Trichosporon asahii var. asahii CBS 2479]|uniref:Sterol metabolism-related protein n=1 Tax=Trichosporon asahii var. asahii (strain ATCC 90039 / CBS 2479 / JCM 2466 / KCTC 7840 / NBRC 103889/ NCYC 2677 / UAMH 7654) TaxID=1186058 RepID=J5QQS8_TRIAS|nr:sterol metabolism-related protein [Trichosporon asahii var. asahii CBS 2479]EJT48613.1 sterol metabolism-related protein [Trichosporon asahii var. asahii CBS 2479]
MSVPVEKVEKVEVVEPVQVKQTKTKSLFSRLLPLFVFLPLLSYFLTGTLHFGQGPAIQHYAKKVYRASPLAPAKKVYTLKQLEKFDGSDPKLPILVSIDGEVYDVTKGGQRMYGKGAAYNMMAGRDASRAFITGCFDTHQTHDLRGIPASELKALDKWKDFMAQKYVHVGRALLPEIDPDSPIPEPCRRDDAAHGREVEAKKAKIAAQERAKRAAAAHAHAGAGAGSNGAKNPHAH